MCNYKKYILGFRENVGMILRVFLPCVCKQKIVENLNFVLKPLSKVPN